MSLTAAALLLVRAPRRIEAQDTPPASAAASNAAVPVASTEQPAPLVAPAEKDHLPEPGVELAPMYYI